MILAASEVLTEDVYDISDAEWRCVVETPVEGTLQQVSSPAGHDDTVQQSIPTATNT